MAALQYNFNLDQGAQFSRYFKRIKRDGTLYNYNTGWTSRMQVRATPASSSSLILNLTTENGGIILQDCYIGIFQSPVQTASISVPAQQNSNLFPKIAYFYDLFLYNASQNIADKFLYGFFNVKGSITQ